MTKSDMIIPVIFIKRGQCPICMKPLIVHDFEATTLMLNLDGSPINILDQKNRVVSYCPSCNYTGDMIRSGMNYTPYFKDIDPEIISNEGFKSLDNKPNPFIKEEGE